MLLGLDSLDTDELLALVGDGLGLALVLEDVEFLTGCRGSVESEYRYRGGRTGFGDLLSALVEHSAHPSVVASAEHHIAHPEGSFLNQHGGKEATALVQRGLYDGTACGLVGVGLELKEVGFKKHLLKKLVNVDSLLGGYLLALVFSSPVLYKDVHL